MSAASVNAVAICTSCEPSSTCRRSWRSATTPPISVKQQDRQLPEEVVEAEVKRRVGQLEDEPRLGDLLHPVADRGGEGAEPQDAEVAVVKGGERAADDGIPGSGRGLWGGTALDNSY